MCVGMSRDSRYIIMLLSPISPRAGKPRRRNGESEARLRLFIEHAPAALAMFDREMRYVSVSRRWLQDYGLGERDLRGLSHYEVFGEISPEWRAVHQRGLAGEVVKSEGDRFERLDGTVQWVRWEVRPWYGSHGEISGILIFTEDITERKNAEAALKQAHEELEERVRQRTRELGQKSTLLEGINRILRAALSSGTEEELNRTALTVAAEVTGARFGFIDELTPEGRLKPLAISDPGWEACEMSGTDGLRAAQTSGGQGAVPARHSGGAAPDRQ